MVGIDALSFYLPHHYLDLQELAAKRDIAYEKLSKGLGVLRSAVPHPQEDAASMAANAALRLILENGTDPSRIGRIYVGTESGIDGAKPIASYVLGMLEDFFEKMYGPDCFRHCDAVDMTFACIGATDALHTTLDWCAAGKDRTGIVIATDYAKYELGSSGEYTQGAGAIAMLVSHNPRLVAIDTGCIATACKDEHDFYKPVRTVEKTDFITAILRELGIDPSLVSAEQIRKVAAGEGFTSGQTTVALHKSTPLFDGQFSNQCYASRVKEAYHHYRELSGITHRNWERIAFHLPYAYHGKRIFPELFLEEAAKDDQLQQEMELLVPGFAEMEQAAQVKEVAKSKTYAAYAQQKIHPGSIVSSEVGNLYTASVFLSLMSLLHHAAAGGDELAGTTIGFCAYGSGSKAKVFDGVVQSGWKEQVSSWKLSEALAGRKALDFDTYEKLHNGEPAELETRAGFYIEHVEPGTYIRQYAYHYPRRKSVPAELELSGEAV